MKNLFQVLLSSLKAKIIPLWTKLKLITNISFLKTRVFTKIRKFFSLLFDIRPRNKNDYVGFGRWLISKRLAIALIVVAGILSAYYIFYVNPPKAFTSDSGKIKTYSYNSLPLRFTTGRVNILARSGYTAYTGDVVKGEVKGVGTLFAPDGKVVYKGDFANNMYNGSGVLYYPSGSARYSGQFKDNLYTGSGIEYRENGTKEYEGNFSLGKRTGEGTLYDAAGNEILRGSFSEGGIIFEELLGKTTGQISNIYRGERVIYMDPDYFVVYLKEIGCAVYGYSTSSTLSGDVPAEGAYVFKNSFSYKGKEYKDAESMKKDFKDPAYEGNAYTIMPEALCAYLLAQKSNLFYGDTGCSFSNTFDDAITVDSFNRDNIVYIYTYVIDGIRYTFFCNDRTGAFEMYLMEKDNVERPVITGIG